MKDPRYRGENFFLSNMFPCVIPSRLGLPDAHSVEHAWHACKTESLGEKRWVLSAPNGFEALHRGRRVALRPDWPVYKRRVEEYLLEQKFIVGASQPPGDFAATCWQNLPEPTLRESLAAAEWELLSPQLQRVRALLEGDEVASDFFALEALVRR